MFWYEDGVSIKGKRLKASCLSKQFQGHFDKSDSLLAET